MAAEQGMSSPRDYLRRHSLDMWGKDQESGKLGQSSPSKASARAYLRSVQTPLPPALEDLLLLFSRTSHMVLLTIFDQCSRHELKEWFLVQVQALIVRQPENPLRYVRA
jgi:hypothetical protein